MFSDRYIDQFGGEGRRFSKKKFKELLTEISDKPFAEQKQLLEEATEAWKNGENQTDDILVGRKITV